MSKIICVTNRRLCADDFLERIRKIAACRPAAIILREKDLDEHAYQILAKQVLETTKAYNTPCVLHGFTKAAIQLGADKIHLPLYVLRGMAAEEKAHFKTLGASCHSVEEAKEAQDLGCTYILAGHVFETLSKEGLPPRGLKFLSDVCTSVSIPVFAIGGIDETNLSFVLQAGAAGACMMSGWMRASNVSEFFSKLQ